MQKYSNAPWRENMLFARLLSDPLKPARIQSPAQTRQHGGHQPGRGFQISVSSGWRSAYYNKEKWLCCRGKVFETWCEPWKWNLTKSGCERLSLRYELMLGLQSETIKKEWLDGREVPLVQSSISWGHETFVTAAFFATSHYHSHRHQCNMTVCCVC